MKLQALCFFIGCFPVFGLTNTNVSLKGTAHDPESGEVLYHEHHQVVCNLSAQPVSGTVLYTDADGKVFAKKTLNYDTNAIQPGFVLNDYRDAYMQHVIIENDTVQVALEQSNTARKPVKSIAAPRSDWVVDAGFNAYVQDHWNQLQQGKFLFFDFLAVTRQSFYRFELFKIEETDTTMTVRMVPNSWLIAMVLDPIDVTYDKNTKALRQYEGLTNLRKDVLEDDYWIATIQYNEGTTLCK